jgi:hypothetical protein
VAEPLGDAAVSVLEPEHCQAVDVCGYQCRRPKDHPETLMHYAKGSTWRGDHADARRQRRPDEPVVKDPAPAGLFMRAENPMLGRMEP